MHYFLLGPSGVGKTRFGDWVEINRDYEHIAIDRGDDPNDLETKCLTDLRNALKPNNATAIARELNKRAASVDKTGCVLTFMSVEFLRAQEIAEFAEHNIAVRYLCGPKERCVEAFVSREAANGHPERDRGFWCDNNKENFGKIADPSLATYRIEVFDSSGNHLSEEDTAKLLGIE